MSGPRTQTFRPLTLADRIIHVIEWLAACFVGIVAADIFISVLLRKFFDTSIPDSYDLGRNLLGILIFWGIAATSYRAFDDVGGDPEAITAAQLSAAGSKSAAQLRSAHLAEHQRLYRRMRLDLGRSAAADKPTDERIAGFASGDDPART